MTKKELEQRVAQLEEHIGALTTCLMELQKLCNLGIKDKTLQSQDIRNLFKSITYKINNTLRYADDEAIILVTKLFRMKKIIRELLRLVDKENDTTNRARKLIG
jgi:hypothetical protein